MNTGLSLRSENCSAPEQRAEVISGENGLGWITHLGALFSLALKNSALGDWLAKNSSSEAFGGKKNFGDQEQES